MRSQERTARFLNQENQNVYAKTPSLVPELEWTIAISDMRLRPEVWKGRNLTFAA